MLRELFNNFLEAVGPLLVVTVFLCTTKYWRQTRHLQLLFLYFLLSLINVGAATWLAFLDKRNMIWYNINGFTSLAVLSAFFYQIIQSRKLKKLIAYFTGAGLLTYLLLLFAWDDNIMFFSAGYSIGSMLIILYCFLFLKEVFTAQDPLSLQAGSIVWIVSGLLAYFMGAYLIQITYKLTTINFLKATKAGFLTPGLLWGVHNVIYCLACSFIAFHLWKRREEFNSEKG